VIDDLYKEIILDHYRNPRGRTPIPAPDRRADGQNPLCGDECSVALAFDGPRVRAVEFRGRGCSISMASGSMMAAAVEGKTEPELRALGETVRGLLSGRVPPSPALGDLESLEGVKQFPVRIKCALLPWTTLEEALAAPAGGAARKATTESEKDEVTS
jgi:nitrogen fixation NifU-like protein